MANIIYYEGGKDGWQDQGKSEEKGRILAPAARKNYIEHQAQKDESLQEASER